MGIRGRAILAVAMLGSCDEGEATRTGGAVVSDGGAQRHWPHSRAALTAGPTRPAVRASPVFVEVTDGRGDHGRWGSPFMFECNARGRSLNGVIMSLQPSEGEFTLFSANVLVIVALGVSTSAQPAASSEKAQSASPTAAKAKNPADQCRDIEELYRKKGLEAARAALAVALKSDNLTPSELAQLYVLEGSFEFDALEEAEALKAFSEALKADPRVEMPGFASPKAELFFAQLKVIIDSPKPLPLNPSGSEAAIPPLRPWAWAPVAGGVVAGGFGVMLISQAQATHDRLVAKDYAISTVDRLDATVAAGKAEQAVGVALLGIGVAGIVSGTAMYFVSSFPFETRVTIQPMREGVAVAIGGVVP